MSARSTDRMDAINHLPEGAILVFPQVSWEEYEELLEDLGDRPGVRVSYDEGRLEIMSPLPEHEKYKDMLYRLACAFAEEFGITLETYGSTTWKRRELGKGSEPDTCFYVANAERVMRKPTLDVESDPPPDIVVEIDVTNESLNKFSIYGALGVPETWRYDTKRVQMYEWNGDKYVEIAASRFFPGLTTSLLTDAVEESKTSGQTAALAVFRRRIRGLQG